MTQSDLIVEYLEQFGVEYVFGVPGSPLGPLFDALARSERRGGPRLILTRHEAGAAFIADGYARESGRIGVCCSTTGPGATNLITGVASAYAEQIPLLVITSQTRIPDFSLGSFQDSTRNGFDIMGMFEHSARYNSMVTHAGQLEKKLAAALTSALGNPRGPAHLSIPIDIFSAEATGPVSYTGLHSLLIAEEASLDNAALNRLWAELSAVLEHKGRIVLLVGSNGAGAGPELTRFAELTGAEIITTPRGKPVINPYHPLARGVFGCSGHASARRALAHEAVKLVLAVGSNLSEFFMVRVASLNAQLDAGIAEFGPDRLSPSATDIEHAMRDGLDRSSRILDCGPGDGRLVSVARFEGIYFSPFFRRSRTPLIISRIRSYSFSVGQVLTTNSA